MRIRNLLIAAGLVAVLAVGLLAGKALEKMGSTDSPSGPGATSSYTLEDIYNRLASGAAGTQSTFTEPTSGPGTGTMHTLDEIMGVAPARDDTDGATTADVLANKEFWGLTGGQWGPETGTMPVGSNVSGPEGSKTFSIPDGFYAGKSATASDTDLLTGNIKAGVNIFSVSGALHAGCTCEGALSGGGRWCDNGDGTVTDMTTGLVWLKKTDWGGTKAWEDCTNHDDAHTRAGLLYAGAGGAGLSDGSVEGDWRLPTKNELYGLTHGTEPVLSGTPRAFTYLQPWWCYWSSTTCTPLTGDAWLVIMGSGNVVEGRKDVVNVVWPVRGQKMP